MRLSEYLKHWLEDVSRPTIRKGTYHLYERLIRLHVVPHVGGVQLANLTLSHVQSLYAQLEERGASARQREMVHNLLHKSLDQAYLWAYVGRNVCDLVTKARVPKKPMKYLNQDQAEQLLKAATKDLYYALFVLALTTGLRQGELFGLKWEDIDFRSCSLNVQRTAYEIKSEVYVGEPKTAKGRRRVELPLIATEALTKHREAMLAEGHIGAWVFCDRNGNLIQRNNFIKRCLRPLLLKAGLPQIRFHDLRHTAATLLLSQGTHPKVVQERLGHAQINITLDTYSHVLPTLQKDAADQLDVMFAGARSSR